MISFDKVNIQYGDTKVLEHFSMQIGRGEKVALSGPSGSGKSTIINAIMGFVTASAGTIKVNDTPVNPENIRSIRKNISWLPQELSFNIKECRRLAYLPFEFQANHSHKPTEEEMNKMLSEFLLPEGILQRTTDEISGGQKQRLMLASILLLKRPILLLDEPTSALDALSAKAVLDYINKQPELTMVSSSHDTGWTQQVTKVIDLKKSSL
ncbi:MAG: hypothetical protein BGN92_12250 [Sphingobacteriales bacterium 41-5]|mgnify:CR=1 FL=1|nr:MAG: hypothetical protein BGN92_12250 [Sphingobacteriales bacterium 41-5]